MAALPLDLTWEAPPGCPDHGAIVARVEQIVGAAAVTRTIAEAKIGERGGQFDLVLTMRGETTDVRRAQASTCNALAETVAVVLALALRPEEVSLPDTNSPTKPVRPKHQVP